MARRIVITQNISLDGVVDAGAEPDDVVLGEHGPDATDTADGPPDDGADVLEVVREHMSGEVGLLVGRRTFEAFRGFWPALTDDDTGITAHLNAVDKYVVSSTMTDPGWANSTVLRGGDGLAGELAALRAGGPDGDIGVTGSVSLCHTLLAGGWVDEVRLFVHPAVEGRGRRLWPDGVAMRGLVLDECRTFRSGVVLQTYRVAR